MAGKSSNGKLRLGEAGSLVALLGVEFEHRPLLALTTKPRSAAAKSTEEETSKAIRGARQSQWSLHSSAPARPDHGGEQLDGRGRRRHLSTTSSTSSTSVPLLLLRGGSS